MDLDGAELLHAAGLRALAVNGLVDPFDLLSNGRQGEGASHRIVLNGDAKAYLDQVRTQSRNGAKNLKRYSARLARDVGDLRLSAPDRDPVALDRLLAWKSAQLRASGLHDVLAADWVKALMRHLFETPQNAFQGLMISLYAGRRHVAGQFGVRLGGHFHPWIAAMDPELRAYSPGMIFQWRAIEAMPDLDLKIYELGPGGSHWKQMFSLDALPVRTGLVLAAGAQARLYDWPSHKVETIGRLRRRLDQIAATELTLAGRTRGVLSALANYERRNAARHAGAPGG
jgi:CelD/BcsL family acetyltransferase involved in cellulose biosynthesis